MEQKLVCEVCKTEMQMVAPPIQPQIQNGIVISTVAMLNAHAECPNCHAKYVTQITGIQLQMGLMLLQEQPRIVVPSMIPPRMPGLS